MTAFTHHPRFCSLIAPNRSHRGALQSLFANLPWIFGVPIHVESPGLTPVLAPNERSR
jgi:hypothetical protein